VLAVGALEAQAPLEVGTMAPEFALVGATRKGVLPDTVRLRDFTGKTVVLAFFYRVRTPG
jgi:peroxiredoxin